MRKDILIVFIITLIFHSLTGQSNQAKIATIGFYNLENLFDTERDTSIRDEEFTPEGKKRWTNDKYQEKLVNMAYVISQMGTDLAPQGLSILGVSEIENRKVLEDLVKQSSIAHRDYKIIHYDSPDDRGIDVGLLYNPLHFEPDTSYVKELILMEGAERKNTRDILVVTGDLDGEKMTFLVNHWPSRRGGQSSSAHKRNKAAMLCREIIDSLQILDPKHKIYVMGDLNDNPNNDSVKKYLKSLGKKADVQEDQLYNPMSDFFRRGLGSNAYRDEWSLFDQILFTHSLLDKDQEGYFFYKANIFNKKMLIQRNGKWKGYPYRTFNFDNYQGGYSDHFPVYITLAKKVN